jgi:hypothetical protein
MSETLDALRAAADGVRHPLLHDLIHQGLATDKPVQLTATGEATLCMLEDEYWAAMQTEFHGEAPEED